MALIKCSECKKEISDKSQCCVHCGCPIEKELICNECGKKINKDDNVCKNCGCPIEKKKDKKKIQNLFMKIWLILCIIICLSISSVNLFNIFKLQMSSIIIGALNINVMGILTLILAINYGILLKTLNKKWFYLLLGVNGIILMYNISYFQMVTHLFYIICVILNVLITFFVVRKKLKSSKFSIKNYLPIFTTIIVAILLTFLLDYRSNIRSNERNANIPQIEIITDYINIRYDKDVHSSVIGEVYFGEIYDIISEDEESSYNWYEIETSNGIRGFIAGKSEDVEYVKELEVNGIITNEEEKQEEEKQEEPTEEKKEETTNKPNTNSNNNSNNNNNNNNNSKPNNNITTKVCNENAKQQLTNEYNTTIEQKINEYNTNINKAQQQIDFAKEALDTTGGYLSASDYETQYQEATSQIQKEMLKNRYGMSVNYDKMVNTYNEIVKTFDTWKNTYKQWYEEELNKIGC